MTKANNSTISCLMWREMIVAALQYATADSINNLCITTILQHILTCIVVISNVNFSSYLKNILI